MALGLTIAMRRDATPPSYEKYGATWEGLALPIVIEMNCIRNGGRWKNKRTGLMAGEGLVTHFKNFISMLWPEHIWHRWNLMELDCFVNYRIIGEIGPASSGKTHSAAIHTLADFYVWSDCTTVLVSSTEREMLEMRVWGEIKKYHRLARERFDWLPGNLIESRQRIITDDRSESADGRDFRNGICFPGGTPVDTPNGTIPIEQIAVGQQIFNATGVGTVSCIHRNIAPSLVRVNLSDERIIDCTPEHPFFTQRGWVNAIDLETFDTVLSAHETMRIVQDDDSQQRDILLREMSPIETMSVLHKANRKRLSQPEVLLGAMSGLSASKKLPSMREAFSTMESKGMEREIYRKVLRSYLCQSMGGKTSGTSEEDNTIVQALWENNDTCLSHTTILFTEMPPPFPNCALSSVRESVRFHSRVSTEKKEPILQLAVQMESHWGEKRTQTRSANQRRTGGMETFPGIYFALSFKHRLNYKTQSQALVSNRSCVPETQIGYRNRRWRSQYPNETSEGQNKNQNPNRAWVDSIEILESSSDPRFDESKGGYRVYNLEVEGHPSYSVNGAIVHNCGIPTKRGGSYQGLGSYSGIKNRRLRMVADECHLMPRVFIDAIANLNKNADFKCIGLGNPKETTDALGILCEPSAELGGWDGGIDQTPKAKTWATRFDKGVCLQLPGSDCPNMDVPEGQPVPFPFLITREAIAADIKFYGIDSLQFTMMDEGRMPRGQGLRRVITRAMCLKFGAMEPPVWKSDERTRIGFLDAAYGSVGGDRCIFGELQFGKDPNNKEILALIDTQLVPVSALLAELPEDQIVNYVKNQCEARNISPENFYFDSTGRGTLVGAFARLWSPNVGLVEFGGRPTDRYVSDNIRVLCKDYYSKFVTELWYSVSLTIQAGQFRGMTEEVLLEGSMREWGFVGANKIEVEPKDKMKLKCGRSPDLFDALVAGLEGARRRGFVIANLRANMRGGNMEEWKRVLQARVRAMDHRHALNYQT